MDNPPSNLRGSRPPDYQPLVSTDELVRHYNSGERYFWDVDLPEKGDLRGITLAEATFNGGWLSDLDLREANLRNVSFLNCNLKCTDFRGADLTGATFEGSSIEATYFANANLTGASFAGAYRYGGQLCDTDMPDDEGRF